MRPLFRRLSVKVLSALTVISLGAVSSVALASTSPSTTIVITQVYGAGGNTGSPFTADYIEIFNLSATSQTLTGWSLQYASATSTGSVSAANVFALPATVTIPAGGYYLVSGQVTAASTGITDPADYATGAPGSAAGFTLSSASGRVYLVNSTTAVSNLAGTDPSVIDFVGYGTAVTYEGASAAPLETNSSATSNGTYDYRTNVCIDTNNNGADFSTAVVQTSGANAPHNSMSALHPCFSAPPSGTGQATPSTQLQGMSTLLTVTVTPGTGSGIAVTANTSAFGGSTTQPLYDDGTHGDAKAGDNIYSFTLPIPASQPTGPYTINATITDTQLDSIPTVTIPLTVIVQTPLTPIHTIQGTPPTASSYIGQSVYTTGIVTGVRATGFYLQAKDSDADTNLATPEGIYVNTGTAPPTAYVAVGNNIQVGGTVTAPIAATGYLASPLEIDNPTGYYLVSTGNALPTPITLTSTNFSATGAYTQLLQYQSMRMTAPSLTTTSGTGGAFTETTESYVSNGQFYSVLTGVARPFRGPGIDIRSPLPTSGAPAGTTRWTPPANVLQVDSAALGGTVIDLTTGATLVPATGVLDYSSGTPLLMISSVTAERPVVTAGTTGTSASGSGSSQFSIGQLNMQRFYNATGGTAGAVVITANDFARRLRKASAAIRNNLAFPDVVAVQEVENLATLTSLAAQISTDAIANSQTDPVYVAYVGTDDANGLANGFLVKSTKINVTGTPVTLTTTANYTDPAKGTQPIWNEPPFLLTASVKRGIAPAYPVDVVSAEFLSTAGINSNTVSGTSTVGASVRAQRMVQAEALANGIVSLTGGAPTTPVVLACSCNAYEFSDGFVDVVGTLVGNPAPASTVVLADSVIATGLTDTTPLLAATDRYVTIENGFADALDHVFYSSATPAGTTIAAVHIDADFNVTYRNDSSTAGTTTPYRTSDHDALVATLAVPIVGALTFTPSSLMFAAQPVGTTSAAKSVVVTNTSTTTAITFTSIVASAGFAQTNNCGTSLAAGGTCTINVTFSPTSAGSPTGTITLTDSDTSGTQTVTLSGTSYNLIASTTTLASSPTNPILTQSVTLTATIPGTTGSGAKVPTGTVQFYDGTTALGSPVTVVSGTTNGTATYTTSSFAAGAHSLKAVYSGDNYFTTSTGTLTLTVAAITSSTTISASPTTTTYGLPVVLTATVTSNLPTPTGTVQFYDGTTALGTPQTLSSSGVATYTSTTLSVGTHSITAVYSGTTTSPAYPTSTSSAVSVVIGPALVLDFTLQIGNTQLIVGGGAPSATTSTAIVGINGFNSPVSLACSSLPSSAMCSFSPATLTISSGTYATGTMTVTTTAAENHFPPFGLGSGGTIALALLLAPFVFRKRKPVLRLLASLVVLAAVAQTLTGCGGKVLPVPTTNTVTVTATAATGQTHTATFTLVTQ